METGTVTGLFLTPSFFDATLMVTNAAANRAYFLTQSFSSTTVTLQIVQPHNAYAG